MVYILNINGASLETRHTDVHKFMCCAVSFAEATKNIKYRSVYANNLIFIIVHCRWARRDTHRKR